jgi:GNAT superfamily N-acetyltransferase
MMPTEEIMKVVDLTPEQEKLYFVCLEDWSEQMKEAGDHKERWYRRTKDMGLRVKLALNDEGQVGGMIQYLPIEHSPAEGTDLNFVHCIWVHGYKQGRGDFRGRGMGAALLAAAEEDSRAQGKKGLVVWGLSIPVFMRAAWFRRHGYKAVDRIGMQVLLWKPFTADAAPPRWVRQKKKPELVPGKVTVSAFINGWCPGQNIVYERARRAAADLGDRVSFQEYQSSRPEVFREWGIADALFIDGRAVRTGPPPSYEKIRRLIEKRVRRLR